MNRRQVRETVFAYVLLLPALLYLGAFLVLILERVLTLSLTHVSPDLETTAFPAVKNYLDLAGSLEFRRAYMRTLLFMLVGTPLQLLVGLLPALLINRAFRGRGMVRSFFVIPLAIPSIVVAVMLYIITNYPFGHLNTLLMGKYDFFPQILGSPIDWRNGAVPALAVSMAGKLWHDMPITMLILLAGLQSVNNEEYEAAATLGANSWLRFWHVTLPHLVPAISTVLVLRSIEMWKEFLFPFILAPRYPLLGTLIEEAYNQWNDPRSAAAVSVVLVLSIVVSTAVIFYAMKLLRRKLVKT